MLVLEESMFSENKSLMIVALLLANGCIPKFKSGAETDRLGHSSKVSSISVKMPNTDTLRSADGRFKVNGLQIVIAPVDRNCPGAVSIDRTFAISGMKSLQEKVTKGCDYDVHASLGMLNGNSNVLAKVFYAMEVPERVTAAMTKNDRISVNLKLSITNEGQQAGFPTSGISSAPDQSGDTPDLQNLPELSRKLQVDLVGVNGRRSLSQVFNKEYLIVDFSQAGCAYCLTLAQRLEHDREFQNMIQNSNRCTFMTIVPAGGLDSWIDALSSIGGQDSLEASSSYEYAGSHSGFAALFGLAAPSTPTIIVADRQGTLHFNQVVGDVPDFSSFCKLPD
jgi:thioredoxin-related protein